MNELWKEPMEEDGLTLGPEEALQKEAEDRLAVEQAARAEEDARLRELYPLPEDDEEYDQEQELETADKVEELKNDIQDSSVEEDGAR